MDKEIASDINKVEQEAAIRGAEVHIKKIVKKCVHSLPSGRKMTVIGRRDQVDTCDGLAAQNRPNMLLSSDKTKEKVNKMTTKRCVTAISGPGTVNIVPEAS